MATPSPDTFKARLPAFASTSNDTLQVFLDEAAGEVGDNWKPSDRTLGIILLAAHKMTLAGVGGSTEAQFGAFKSLKIGSLQLERDSRGSNEPARGTLGSTSFGTQFMDIALRNVGPAIFTV